MRRLPPAIALILLLPLTVAACLWDRDTPYDEAKGLPEVVAVLTGRFERNPPLFYRMRLTRVASSLKAHPEDLAAYDDAGVACDRLGRGDEAISWMERKRAQLEKVDGARAEVKEQWYRYHANLGTFLVHRWIRKGGDRAKIDEVKAARDEIARALEINPNAHFGREKYQLMALRWIADPPVVQPYEVPNLLGWPGNAMTDHIAPREADAAVRGLSGLIVLGNAWESVDVYHALGVALMHDSAGLAESNTAARNTLAYLAWLRCRELIDAGRGSILPGASKGEALKNALSHPHFVEADKVLDAAYPKLRAEADAWHAARTAFMMKRLQDGRHPDTDPKFWDGYTEAPAPELPSQTLPGRQGAVRSWMLGNAKLAIFLGLSLVLVTTWAALKGVRILWARAHPAKPGDAGLGLGDGIA